MEDFAAAPLVAAGWFGGFFDNVGGAIYDAAGGLADAAGGIFDGAGDFIAD